MIIMCEGPRGAGKSHLVDSFFARCKRENVHYYKWALSDWTKYLKLENQETESVYHYFTVPNFLTILELNDTILKDKIIVFDRAILSAYVWSIFRKRMNEDRLIEEFEKILNHPSFKNIVTVHLTKAENNKGIERVKTDIFDKYENYEIESKIYEKMINRFEKELSDSYKNNRLIKFANNFDFSSELSFDNLLYSIIDK